MAASLLSIGVDEDWASVWCLIRAEQPFHVRMIVQTMWREGAKRSCKQAAWYGRVGTHSWHTKSLPTWTWSWKQTVWNQASLTVYGVVPSKKWLWLDVCSRYKRMLASQSAFKNKCFHKRWSTNMSNHFWNITFEHMIDCSCVWLVGWNKDSPHPQDESLVKHDNAI